MLAPVVLDAALERGAIDPRIEGMFEARVHATGLTTPDGLAFHPGTGELYVSEEEPGRISVIRDGKPVVVITAGFEVINDLPAWAFTPEHDFNYWMRGTLRNPEGIAFNEKGHLFVTEDVAHGRLLEFVPNEDGSYSKAHAIPIPWLQMPYSWESVTIAKDGRLFLAGSTTENGPGIFYGTVLMRDPGGEWWIVDYGPFASFSSLALSKDEEVLIVGEEVSGSLSWWDAVRHQEVGFVSDMLPNIEGISVLKDGSILAAQESEMKLGDQLKGHNPLAKGGALVRIDPQTEEIQRLARGFGLIESTVVDHESGYIYVTEESSGSILELRPLSVGLFAEDNLLARATHSRELNDGRAPKKWPSFLKEFVEDLGFKPVDELPAYVGEAPLPNVSLMKSRMTLERFSQRIPLIAGKVKVTELIRGMGGDPVDEVSFVIFYPNMVSGDSGYETPSLTLFSAKYKSGKKVKTEMLTGMAKGAYRLGEGGRRIPPDNGSLYIPMGFANSQPFGRGSQLNLSFMGIDMFDDYYLNLQSGVRETGRLSVDERRGGDKAHYKVTWIEKDTEGNTKRNLVVAGFDRQTETFGWQKLGNAPTPTIMTRSPSTLPFVTRHTHEIRKLAVQNEEEWRLAMGYQRAPNIMLGVLPNDIRTTETSRTVDYQPIVIDRQVDVSAVTRVDKPFVLGEEADLEASAGGDERRAEGPVDEGQAGEPSADNIVPLADTDVEGEEDGDTITLSKAIRTWKVGNF